MISGLTNHQGFPFDVYFSIYGVRYVLDLMLFHFFATLFIGCCFLFIISSSATIPHNEAQERYRYELPSSTDSCSYFGSDVSRHTWRARNNTVRPSLTWVGNGEVYGRSNIFVLFGLYPRNIRHLFSPLSAVRPRVTLYFSCFRIIYIFILFTSVFF